MLLIADSGSTKCDWRLVAEDKSYVDFKSIGINPYFLNEEEIETELRMSKELLDSADKVTAVFFYGAGCSSTELKRTVDRGLGTVFTKAQIFVDHDLVAAAFAVYDDEPCIACILGTGSNSCHFDGDIVREEVPALAYILGDEGSGSFFGKKLLSDYLYKRLPSNIHSALKEEYQLTKDVIIDRIYMQDNANVYLASFMKFITKFRGESYVDDMIRQGIDRFLDIHVTCFKDHKIVKTHFVGSVAHFQEDLLREVAQLRHIQVGTVIEKPIEGLYNHHLKNYFTKIPFKH